MNEVVAYILLDSVSESSSCPAAVSRLMFIYFVTSAWQLIHLRHPEKQV
jgi:hypothetical protein